jgi:hypothetical protein
MSARNEQPDWDGAAPAKASGRSWWFAVNSFLAILVLTLAVAWASVLQVRASALASADPTSDPASPLTISGISSLELGIASEAVHVGATQRTLIVTFAASPIWHASSRDCLADIVGVVDWTGETTWVGARAGHVDAIAGDPSSSSAYIAGPGPYCEAGRFVSGDGGLTWSTGSLPGNAASSPPWFAFDPARPHTLLAFYPGTLYVSSDAGRTWTTRPSTVAPLAFDIAGRLAGWEAGKLLESADDGASWQETGPGPAVRPAAAGATANGTFLGGRDGLWWYPLTAAPSLIQSGTVFSIATVGDGAVVLGVDAMGHPWLGTVTGSEPGIALAALPPDMASLQITGGGVAANDSGAVAAFAGRSSEIASISFTR